MSQSTPPVQISEMTTKSPSLSTRASTSVPTTIPAMTTSQRSMTQINIMTSAPKSAGNLTTDPPDTATDWIAIGVAIGINLLAIAIITALVCWWRARKRRRREEEERDMDLGPSDNLGFSSRPSGRQTRSPSQDYVNPPIVPSSVPRPSIAGVAEGWEVPEENIKLLKELGRGQFGKVYKAEAYGIDRQDRWRIVAIKTLRTEDQTAQEDFVKEQRVMSKLQHAQLVRMLGCCTTSDPLLLIMEFMENGDLVKFLRDHHDNFHSDRPCPGDHPGPLCLTPKRLAAFAHDVARGMGYLESKKIVHRDLAARNILLDKDYRCKVSDFGLARAIYDAEAYMIQDKSRPLPVFWMSLESLCEGEFTSKSDVWAFGIVLWELATLGGRPYPGMDGMEVQHQLRRGYRMPKPRNCSEEMYRVMRWCWDRDPERRPVFRQLVAEMDKLKQDRPGHGPSVSSSTSQHSAGRRSSSDVSPWVSPRRDSDVSSRLDSEVGRFDVFLQ